MGWFSAALLPMIRTTLLFLMSIQWLVMAPRPKDSARAPTVELWQMRAWLSMYTSPKARIMDWYSQPSSLSTAALPAEASSRVRLTGCPWPLTFWKEASRTALSLRAMRGKAQSQDFSSHLSEYGAR